MMRDRIQMGFYRFGWLIPAYLPLMEVMGRAWFNVVGVFYLLWAAASLPGRLPAARPCVVVYGLMLAAFGLSVGSALDIGRALEKYVLYAASSTVFLFTLMALDRVDRGLERLLHALAVCAGLVGLYLFVHLGFLLFGSKPFHPSMQLKEDNLPWLFCLFALALYRRDDDKWRAAWMSVAFLAVLAYVLLSQGRAALLGWIVACMLLWYFHAPRYRHYLLLLPVFLLIAAMLFSANFFRGAQIGEGLMEVLDRFTTGRSVLWRQALQYPPENLWTGTGMGNVELHAQVVTIGEETVRHLHNFIFDAWFETGFLGLAALLAWLACGVYAGWRLASMGAGEDARIAAALLAAVFAILAAGLFSFSYTSRPFAVYLPMLFAALVWMHARRRAVP